MKMNSPLDRRKVFKESTGEDYFLRYLLRCLKRCRILTTSMGMIKTTAPIRPILCKNVLIQRNLEKTNVQIHSTVYLHRSTSKLRKTQKYRQRRILIIFVHLRVTTKRKLGARQGNGGSGGVLLPFATSDFETNIG